MELQKRISFEKNQNKIGQTIPVMVDRKENEHYIGRTEADSPDVDQEVIFTSHIPLEPGTIAQVQITGAMEYDLEGKLCD
jgi:ribosomal protein S12 methylthiotransferase